MTEATRRGKTGVLTRRPSGPPEWHSAKLDDYKIRCLTPFRRFRGTEIPWDDAKTLAMTTEQVVKASRSRKVVKLAAGQFGAPLEVYVKRYNFKSWYGPYLRAMRKSRAREEFDLGWKLMELGIRTPRPVWLAEARGALSPFSLIATEAIPESDNAVERWRRLVNEQDRADLLVATAHFLLMMHEKSFFHDDCKATHVLVLPHAPSSPEEFFIIDLLGCSIRKRLTKARRAMNLYQFLRTFHSPQRKLPFSEEHRRIFLEAYGGSAKDAEKWERQIERIGNAKGKVI
ncbi:MAG: lipopolysaccharide kinase InaA family protein [Planctomycetes bacterium]|nr:lipopolysaccharide kinase InaA family protein [Planctomycetota bacterium]